jgi:hypothetical protein
VQRVADEVWQWLCQSLKCHPGIDFTGPVKTIPFDSIGITNLATGISGIAWFERLSALIWVQTQGFTWWYAVKESGTGQGVAISRPGGAEILRDEVLDQILASLASVDQALAAKLNEPSA